MLVGRDRERGHIREAMEAARLGHGVALVLRGEPGIGKTALLEDLRRDAEGFRVLSTRGLESESRLAFAGLADVLRPVLDRMEGVPEPQRAALLAALALGPPVVPDRFAAYAATLSLLSRVAAEGPLMVVVDDAHWLDLPSQEALLFCARRLRDDAVLMLASSREQPPEDLELSGVQELRIEGVDRAAARRILERAAGDEPLAPAVAEALLDLAAGNPLALVELPRALTPDQRAGRAPLPRMPRAGDALAAAYRRRMQALSPPQRRALLLAAVSDDGALAPIAAALSANGGTAVLGGAEAAGFLELGHEAARFRHPLLRAIALELADPQERRDAHRRLAESLDPDHDVEQRAWHLAEAAVGPDDEVAYALEQAAMRAAGRTGYAEAAGALERAAALSTQPLEAARMLLAAARFAFLAGRARRGLAILDRAGRLAADAPMAAEMDHLRALCLMWSESPDRAYELLVGVVDRIAASDPAAAALAAVDAVATRAMAGRCRDALAMARRAAALARRSGDEGARMAAAAVLGMALVLQGDVRRGEEVAGPALYRAALATDPLSPQYAHFLFGANGWLFTDEQERTVVVVGRLVELARRLGAPGLLPYAVSLAGEAEFRLGQWAMALASARESVALGEEIGSAVVLTRAKTMLAQVLAAQGRSDEAAALAGEAVAVSRETGVGSMVNVATWVLGFVHLSEGAPELALPHLEFVAEFSREQSLGNPQVFPWQPDLVEAYVRLGRLRDARRTLATLAEQAHRTGGTWARAVTCRGRGMIDPDFDRHFAQALALHALSPTPFERARTELSYGARLRRAGRRTEARAQLERALSGFEDLGAQQWARQAREEIAASGARLRPRRATAGDDELSPRELQVAMAVAEGLTNREVAARLFLSEKTVERHLGSVYRRLGLRSRTQLARHFAGPAGSGGGG